MTDILSHYSNTQLPLWKLQFIVFVALNAPDRPCVFGKKRRLLNLAYRHIGKSSDSNHLNLLIDIHLELGSMAEQEYRVHEVEYHMQMLDRVERLSNLTEEDARLLLRIRYRLGLIV